MISKRSVVIDVEGFRCKKNAFVDKELAKHHQSTATDSLFLLAVNFNILPKLEQKLTTG